MKIPAAKAAVEKEWEKLENISAWNLTKVRSKKEVIDEARASGATVHFGAGANGSELTGDGSFGEQRPYDTEQDDV